MEGERERERGERKRKRRGRKDMEKEKGKMRRERGRGCDMDLRTVRKGAAQKEIELCLCRRERRSLKERKGAKKRREQPTSLLLSIASLSACFCFWSSISTSTVCPLSCFASLYLLSCLLFFHSSLLLFRSAKPAFFIAETTLSALRPTSLITVQNIRNSSFEI